VAKPSNRNGSKHFFFCKKSRKKLPFAGECGRCGDNARQHVMARFDRAIQAVIDGSANDALKAAIF
jgi:hypothetical protein